LARTGSSSSFQSGQCVNDLTRRSLGQKAISDDKRPTTSEISYDIGMLKRRRSTGYCAELEQIRTKHGLRASVTSTEARPCRIPPTSHQHPVNRHRANWLSASANRTTAKAPAAN
jgi:hypothetical protein